jgi:hypothetical protein
MKKFLLLTLLLSLAGMVRAVPVRPTVQPVRQATSLFVLEIDRSLRGARVAVQHAGGDVVLMDKIRKKRVVIDFSDVEQGTYTITLCKGLARQVHLFTKR